MQGVGRARVLVLTVKRVWRIEVAAFCAPPLALVVALCAPAIPAIKTSGATIANVAAVQGAVTGLSLIALVLAVEMARRQEDRDDTVYEIMLRDAWIRPTFMFAVTALLSTTIAMALSDFTVAPDSASNRLICAYFLAGAVSMGLLLTVLRTVRALRPTAVIAYRIRANEDERHRRIVQFVDQRLGKTEPGGALRESTAGAYDAPRTAEQRLFVEIDDAIASQQGSRFDEAIDRLHDLIVASADQIEASGVSYQTPSREVRHLWYPLDAVSQRLNSLWQTAYRRDDTTFMGAMLSFQYRLLAAAANRRSGELLEIGLQSSVTAYLAAEPQHRATWRLAWREWANIESAVWWRLTDDATRKPLPGASPFLERIVEHLQSYGNLILLNDDVLSFNRMLDGFRDVIERLGESRRYLLYGPEGDQPVDFDIHHYLMLALLALGGRAILLKEAEQIEDAKPYLESLDRFVKEHARPERFTAAVFERERDVQGQWSWWEMPSETDPEQLALFIMPERYPIVGLLYWLQTDPSSEPLPSFHGYAQRFIDMWTSHGDAILDTAGIAVDERGDASGQLIAHLRTSIDAEQREREDRAIVAKIDLQRVKEFVDNLRTKRREDRLLEHVFESTRRVRWLDDDAWRDGRLAHAWLLPRDVFTVGMDILPLEFRDAALAFERGLFATLAARLEGARELAAISEASADELLRVVDIGLAELNADHPLIVLHGSWPNDVLFGLLMRASEDEHGPPLPGRSAFRQIWSAYKGHWLVRSWTDDAPELLMLDLERWGWLVRAPVDGEDFGLELQEIDREAAERIVDESPVEDDDREQRIREQMLKVRLVAQERVKFEVENPDSALRIPVRLDEGA